LSDLVDIPVLAGGKEIGEVDKKKEQAICKIAGFNHIIFIGEKMKDHTEKGNSHHLANLR
jgi:hypothetical protein